MENKDIIIEELIRENKRLCEKIEIIKELAFTDSLTGVINRRGMYQKVIDSLYNDFVIANCDLDNFKSVNDTLGHDVGDKVLKDICNLINGCLGNDSFLVRLGGDEFLLFLTGEDIDKSNVLVDNIKNDIEMLGNFVYNEVVDSSKKLSVSTGLINYNSLDDKANYVMLGNDIISMSEETIGLLFVDLTRCINDSDEKLYSVKRLSKGEIKNE